MSIFFNNQFSDLNNELFSSFPMRYAKDSYPKDLINNENMWSYIRILHAFPKNIDVTVSINDNIIATGLNYGSFTEFFHVTGTVPYILKVTPTNSTIPIFTTTLQIEPKNIFTVAIVGTIASGVSVLLIPEPEFKIDSSICYFRFCNLSPNSESVNVSLPDKTRLFIDVAFTEYTEYIELYSRNFTFNISNFSNGNDVLYVPNISLGKGKIYTMYLIGLYQGQPSQKVLVPLDGNTYIDF